MSSFVRVAVDESLVDEAIELPTEENGTLLLDSLKSQYGGATGLKYRNSETGGWRGVRLSDGALHPPHGLWGDTTYIVVSPNIKAPGAKEHSSDGVKRRITDDEYVDRAAKNPRHAPYYDGGDEMYGGGDSSNHGDLIVLGLSYGATDQDLKSYFEKFGEVEFSQVKRDMSTGASRGFGFIRMKDPAIHANILTMEHTICGRRCELRPPKKAQGQNRVFVGRLPAGVTKADLTDYFERYGTLRDVYIPKPFRGFAFLTFLTAEEAEAAMRDEHMLKGCAINVTEAEPRDKNAMGTPQNFTAAQWAQYYAQQGWLPSMLSQQPLTFPRTAGQSSTSSSLWGDSQTWAQQAASYHQQQQQQQQQQQSLEQRTAYQFSSPAGPTVPSSQRPSRPPF